LNLATENRRLVYDRTNSKKEEVSDNGKR